MALQGTLDTFALSDVLRLLAVTKKSGRLHLDGDRGSGSIWVESGEVTGIEATTAPSDAATENLFELLRIGEGTFTFRLGDSHPDPEVGTPVEPLLQDAEALLAEWRTIEAVVPSLSAWVALAAELNPPKVTLNRDRWRTIAAIGAGTTVGALGQSLGLGEVAVSRCVKELVEAELVVVEPRASDVSWAADPFEEPILPSREEDEPVAAPLPPLPASPTPRARRAATTVRQVTEDYEAVFPGLHRRDDDEEEHEVAVTRSPRAQTSDLEADEVARQLARLSPRAAEAVRAAAEAATEEERDAALAEVDDDAEPVNRGLLLKFLSSVQS